MTVQTLTYRCPHCRRNVEVEPHSGSELVVCPNADCAKPFQVDVPSGKPVAPTAAPVPAAPAQAQPAAPAVAAPAGPVAKPADQVEQEVLRVQLAMFRRYPFRCLGYGLLFVAGIVGVIWSAVESLTILAVLLAAVTAIVLARFVHWWLRMQSTTFIVTNRRCVIESGITSKQTAEVRLVDLKDVLVHQNFWQRLIDVGDLSLDIRAPDASKKIVVMAVMSPMAIAERIKAIT